MLRAFCSILVAVGGIGMASANIAAQERPPLQVHQGQYFRYVMPPGWTANETTNGVEMTAPDGLTAASFVLLMGALGQTTPGTFIDWNLANAGYTHVQAERTKDLPDQPGPLGMVWRVTERQVRFTFRGIPIRGLLTCGVIQGFGQYSAVLRLYQAPARNWARARFWLPAIAEGVAIIDPRQVAGLDRMQLPRNIPHDEIFGEFNRAWQVRQVPHDRLSQARREADMGYERLADPDTGQLYEVPLESYDAKVGGYRNPRRPMELLVNPPPGH